MVLSQKISDYSSKISVKSLADDKAFLEKLADELVIIKRERLKNDPEIIYETENLLDSLHLKLREIKKKRPDSLEAKKFTRETEQTLIRLRSSCAGLANRTEKGGWNDKYYLDVLMLGRNLEDLAALLASVVTISVNSNVFWN